MIQRPLLLAALVLLTPLAGCAGDYRGIDSVHQPVVRQTDYALDLLAGADGLAGGEAQRLRAWLAVLSPEPGAAIAIDDPAAAPDTRAAIEAVAAEHGLRVRPLTAAAAAVAPGMVRVVVTRSSASVPSCDVPAERSALVDFDAHASRSFGCAVNGTLAAMVANPDDLIRGRADDGTYTAGTAAKAIGAWRKAAPTGGGGTVIVGEKTGAR